MKDDKKPDFGYTEPVRTKTPCTDPAFADNHLHRVGIFKVEHWGAKGDRDENGLPGWTTQKICMQCGRKFKPDAFYQDPVNN